MTLLPIVERELRVAARSPLAFWLRVAAALVTVLIASGFLLFSAVGFVSPAQIGKTLFALLSWLVFLPLGLAGMFFTADCLSREKREGTLGLLFLTDLRGLDVVLGKLTASSVRAVFGLLATFPILALPLVMGGVTGGEFWRTVLALVNALVFSLAAGMFVSSVSREARRAQSATFVLVLLVNVAPVLLDALLAAIRNVWVAQLSLASPAFAFYAAINDAARFWPAFGLTLTATLVLLGLSCVILPRSWQERARLNSGVGGSWFYRLQYGSEAWRARRRKTLLPVNPVLWLCRRPRWQGFSSRGGLALSVAGGVVAVATMCLLDMRSSSFWLTQAGSVVVMLAGWILALWVAWEAPRFFSEARRNGALELILATPLTAREIVSGHWQSLTWRFAGPALLLAVMQVVLGLAQMGLMPEKLLADRSFFGLGVGPVGGVLSAVTRLADLATLAWVGAWLGLTSRSGSFATAKCLVLVQVVPWFASLFVTPFLFLPLMLVAGMQSSISGGMFWIPVLLSGALWLVKDWLFFRWAHRRLVAELRHRAAG
jgi:ABC-type transport system involved in multi-copper enzyme maturation permease subunit